ncbi:hypothetical protein AAG906_019490 [Vitis piasezkii]
MDDLFKLANKYFMLEDDNDHAGNSKPSNQLRQANKGRDDQDRSRWIRLNGIGAEGAPIIKIMVIPPNSAEATTT